MYKIYFNSYNNKYILFNTSTMQYKIVNSIDEGIRQRGEFINFAQSVEYMKEFTRV
jgi:hypothetical protein